MTPKQKRRLSVITIILIGTSVAAFIALKAFQSSITYFLDPAAVAEKGYNLTDHYRVGGLVKTGSVARLEDDVTMTFAITDCEHDVVVHYTGILPDLFREGQGVVVNGKFNEQGTFVATEVLAKHDENYVPAELAEEMMEKQQQQCGPGEA
jgi:cytochrome c-type biogenesis protein CcmE